MQSVANQNFSLNNRRHLLLALTKPKVTLQVARLHAAHKCPEICHALVGSHVLVVAGRIQSGPMVGGGSNAVADRVAILQSENSRNILLTRSCRLRFYDEAEGLAGALPFYNTSYDH